MPFHPKQATRETPRPPLSSSARFARPWTPLLSTLRHGDNKMSAIRKVLGGKCQHMSRAISRSGTRTLVACLNADALTRTT
eukprot:2554223-Pleurochrysis_carterae.AAC.8